MSVLAIVPVQVDAVGRAVGEFYGEFFVGRDGGVDVDFAGGGDGGRVGCRLGGC